MAAKEHSRKKFRDWLDTIDIKTIIGYEYNAKYGKWLYTYDRLEFEKRYRDWVSNKNQ